MEQKREFTGIWIPKEIIEDETLTKSEMIIYAEIACFTECRKSNEALGIRWKLKKNTVSIIISSLIKKGFITSNNKTGEYRKLYANQRGSIIKIKEALSEKSKSLCDKNHTRENRENTERIHTNVQQSLDECPDFKIFYNSYPRKEGKGQARRAFNTAKKKVSLEKMLASLEKHKKKWQDPKYIPLPATWLNGERWDDEIKDKIIQKNNFISL